MPPINDANHALIIVQIVLKAEQAALYAIVAQLEAIEQ